MYFALFGFLSPIGFILLCPPFAFEAVDIFCKIFELSGLTVTALVMRFPIN